MPRLLITAGPTHEPIDSVRYIANRSSGRLGMALAESGAARGWPVELLLGPVGEVTAVAGVSVRRFVTTADLERLLMERFPHCDILIQAAAVADFRPLAGPGGAGKIERSSEGLTLRLESTPDLVAACTRVRRADQRVVAFALEARETMLERARAKLERKGVDFIVANPLETMESGEIEGFLLRPHETGANTPGPLPKRDFAEWLLDQLVSPP